MIAVAIFFDILQIILLLLFIGLFVNWIITAVAGIVFYLWFRLSDVSFFDGRSTKLLASGGGLLFELFPGFNGIPTMTISVILTILIVKKEDARYNIMKRETSEKQRAQAANDNQRAVENMSQAA